MPARANITNPNGRHWQIPARRDQWHTLELGRFYGTPAHSLVLRDPPAPAAVFLVAQRRALELLDVAERLLEEL